MQTENLNLHEQIITDSHGHKKVVLDYDVFEYFKSLLKKAGHVRHTVTFASCVGLALKAPLNPNPRFKTDDDLWERK